jgi:hypothetical protein
MSIEPATASNGRTGYQASEFGQLTPERTVRSAAERKPATPALEDRHHGAPQVTQRLFYEHDNDEMMTARSRVVAEARDYAALLLVAALIGLPAGAAMAGVADATIGLSPGAQYNLVPILAGVVAAVLELTDRRPTVPRGGLFALTYLVGTVPALAVAVVVSGGDPSQAIVAPTAAQPTATIDTVDRSPAESPRPESIRVTVRLENEGETGLSSVEVVVHCGSVERSLTFTHVPARGRQTGIAVCPQGTTPDGSVSTLV